MENKIVKVAFRILVEMEIVVFVNMDDICKIVEHIQGFVVKEVKLEGKINEKMVNVET